MQTDRSALTENIIRFCGNTHTYILQLDISTLVFSCTGYTVPKPYTSCDAALIEQRWRAACSECCSKISKTDSHVRTCPYGNIIHTGSLLKSGWAKIATNPWFPRSAGQNRERSLYLRVVMCELSSERGSERWGLKYSSSGKHWFSGPAWGCGKCQPLIELIKPFWVSDVNMVSPTKGHCIKQHPLGCPWGMKGLLICVCVC